MDSNVVAPRATGTQAPTAPPTLVAEVTRVRYHADETGFTIASAVDANGEHHTLKGVFTDIPAIGRTYAFAGAWVNDPTYGRQLNVDTLRSVLPENAEGIRRYLEENASFIGPAVARALVERYGADTLRALKQDPERVANEVSGITSERAERIARDLRANAAAEEQAIALAQLLGPCDIGPALRRRVALSNLGSRNELTPAMRITQIRENPYVLTRVDGIGFKRADMVARKCGLAPDDPRRIRAGIAHVLGELTKRDGHVRIPATVLQPAAAAVLLLDVRQVAQEMMGMVERGELIQADVANTAQLYLPPMHADEQYIAEKLTALLPINAKRVKLTATAGTKFEEGLAPDQRAAVRACADAGVFVLTGAPGTGKTFTIRRIIDAFPQSMTRLAAPTGKAAKRMTEMVAGSGYTATTIHRLLGPERDPKTGGFRFTYNAYNKLAADIVIIDEFSMVDNWLCARLLEALDTRTRLIIVGDHYQLPSVGPGNVLRDMIASGAIPTVELETIKRQDAGFIVRSCHSIKSGGDIIAACGEGQHDLQFIAVDGGVDGGAGAGAGAGDEGAVAERVIHLVDMFRRTGWNPLRQVQVISALRTKTALGCAPLNYRLQQLLNGAALKTENTPFRPGDKVIQTRNDYDNDIVNGDIGYVESIYTAGKLKNKIVVNFENPSRRVTLSLRANALELAYAVTCHKYQGSECDVVIVPVHACLGNLVVQRSWLYTAISRARKCCVLIGDRGQIAKIVERTRSQERWTGLAGGLRRLKDARR